MMAVESANFDLVTECLNNNMNPFLKDALNRQALDYAGKQHGQTENPREDRDERELLTEAMEQW